MCTPQEFFEARFKYIYRKEGKEEGINEGIIKTKLEDIHFILKNSNMSFDEAASLIELNEEHKEEIRKILFSL